MGRRLTRIENTEGGRYLLKFAARTSADTDVVVGANGIINIVEKTVRPASQSY